MGPWRRLSRSPHSATTTCGSLREGIARGGRRPGRCRAGARLPASAKASRSRAILATHHHRDHVGGVAALAERFDAPVYGPARESIPVADARRWREGDASTSRCIDDAFRVLDIPGHTAGHIAFFGRVGGAPVRVLRRHAVRGGMRPAVRGHGRSRCGRRSASSRRCRPTRACTAGTSTRSRTFASRPRSNRAMPRSRERVQREQRQAGARRARRCRRRSREELATNPFLRAARACGPRGRGGACRAAARRTTSRCSRRCATLEERVRRLAAAGDARVGLTLSRRGAPTIARSSSGGASGDAGGPRSDIAIAGYCVTTCGRWRHPRLADRRARRLRDDPAARHATEPAPPPSPAAGAAIRCRAAAANRGAADREVRRAARVLCGRRRRSRAAARAGRGPVGPDRQGLRGSRSRRSAGREVGAYYAERPDYVARMIDRSRRYLYHIVNEIDAARTCRSTSRCCR